MSIKALRNYWLHILLWLVMVLYVIYAPDLYALTFTKAGRPLQTEDAIPPESDNITFIVEGLEPDFVDGKSVHNLYGWAYITLEQGGTVDEFIREVALISDKRVYFFAASTVYRNPGLQSMFSDQAIDLDTLGFNTSIVEDTIKPGKYRIGIIFRNPSTGSAYYRDKPAHFLIKTPNTITLE